MVTTNDDTGNAGALSVSLTIDDDDLVIRDNSDTTKAFQFQASGITTATTRTYTVPDADGTMALIAATQTLTNKTIALGSNTVSGTLAQFNTALSDDNFVSLTGSETLTNKTLTTPTIGSFANATHNHTNAAGGGQITTAALSNHTTWTTFTPAFAASGGSGGTVTVTANTTGRYQVTDKRITLLVDQTVTLSAAPDTISMTIPGSFTSAQSVRTACPGFNAGADVTPYSIAVSSGGTTVVIRRSLSGGTAWTTGANTIISFSFTFEIQ